MTVSYNLDVVETSFWGFLKLQFRWRGSIWKSVLRELVIFTLLFAVVAAILRTDHILSEQTRLYCENFAALFDQKMDYIPLTFMLGFFVTIIVGRWNEIFINIGWIDNTALVMSTYLRGSDEKSRIMRRNVIRYMVLTQVLIFRDISMQVRKRFPTLDTVVAAGFMNECERQKYEELNFKYNKYFLPIQWAYTLLFEARQGGKLAADLMLNECIKHITEFRNGLAKLCNFDWVPIPLVYPQVVFLAVRSYFFLCLVARQSVLIDGEIPKDGNRYYPLVPFLMTCLQFMFYIGWMKVAESLMNPLGEDDDDFECNFLIDRNITLGLTIVDETYNTLPPQQKDIFWADKVELLYAEDSSKKHINPLIGSVANVETEADEVIMVPHVDADAEVDCSFDCGEGTRLLPRGYSVVSVNRGGSKMGSKTSLASRKGVFESIRKQFSRDSGRLSRPNKLQFSRTSLYTPDGKPTIEIVGESTLNILDELANEHKSSINNGMLTPDDLSPHSPTRRSPCDNAMPTLPEEDEEHQRTRTSVDLAKWRKQMQDEEMQKNTDRNEND